MKVCFLETTVLTNLLLKRDGSEVAAATILESFDETVIPQFSWKEFKRGPLSYFRWAHNKLVKTQSLLETFAALQRISMSPKRYLTSTAIQALHTAFDDLFSDFSWPALQKKYGTKAERQKVFADALIFKLQLQIFRAWGQRKTL